MYAVKYRIHFLNCIICVKEESTYKANDIVLPLTKFPALESVAREIVVRTRGSKCG